MAIVCRLNIENMLTTKYTGGGGAIIQGASQAKLSTEGWTGDCFEIFAPTHPPFPLSSSDPNIKHMSAMSISMSVFRNINIFKYPLKKVTIILHQL